jgi:hypothetical protein
MAVRRAHARRATGNHQEKSSDMNRSGVFLPAPLANGAAFGVGASFFLALRVPALAGLHYGETVASQAKITLVQQPNLLVLWALAGWVWRV